MSTPIKDGGPAFPMQDASSLHSYAYDKLQGITDPNERDRVYMAAKAEAIVGMTLRDYFAGQALVGMLMNYTTAKFGLAEISVANHAYKLADAMLAAREAGK
jgi:glutamyl-tRNA reductase